MRGLLALALVALAVLAACSSDPDALFLDVTADQDAPRLRAQVKGPAGEPAQSFEFDVDPTGQGRDLTDASDPYQLALRFAASGHYVVHLVDVPAGGVATQQWTSGFDVSGVVRADAHLELLPAGEDDDGDGWPEHCPVSQPGCVADCNDGDPSTNPFAFDICEDGVDQDCDGSDRACADADGDGFPEACGTDTSCQPDCDDTNAAVNPGVHESSTTCDGSTPDDRHCDDGLDNDCDGTDAACHTDGDCDGFYPTSEPGGTDCDDASAAAHPGAIDVCDDGIDQDCDGTADDGCARCDEDGDGEFGFHPERGCDVAVAERDCDDSDRAVNHKATEDCGGSEGAAACALRGYCARPGVDEDCDGMVNEGCPPAACDADGDGFARADCPTPPPPNLTDCNDDPAQGGRQIFPGAPDNCKTATLENCNVALPCSADADGDGYNAGGGDCNDHDAAIHPWAVELCNGVDDDCDGVVDEGNPTLDGTASLDASTCTFDSDGLCGGTPRGRCVCSPTASDGQMDPAGRRSFCPGEPTGTPAAWGARCFGAVQPAKEKCDALDQDCDGRNDDPTGANLDPSELGQPCDNLPGPCVQGHVIGCDNSQTTPYFTNPHWVCSADEQGPQPETCNGINDNCDGQTDEGFGLGMACDGADGDLCKEGVIQCSASGGTQCSDTTATNVEACNGADDDCDGQIDEDFANLGNPCDGPDGDFCNEGTIVCNGAGNGTVCSDATSTNVERCNGLDDDCDGQTDEDFPTLGQTCDGADTDLCKEGILVCSPGGGTVVCNDVSGNTVERCNGNDDDCDGMIDEDFPTLGQSCDGADSDLCKEGVFVCAANGLGVVCNDTTSSTTEKCNGLDDDCDGMIDEDFTTLGDACDGADTDLCKEGVFVCNAGGTGVTCNDTTGSTTETCNGTDDDCDGTIDDGAGATCGARADTCTAGACRCGSNPVCDAAVADTCTAGVCKCGATAACDPTLSDSCTSGTCQCGNGPACAAGQTCSAGACM